MRSGTLILALIVTTPLFAATPKRRAVSPERCTEVVSPAAVSFPSAGGSATVIVTVNGGCTWSPIASDAWITVTQTANTITVTSSANSATTPRTTLIHVRSAVIVVTQSATTNLLQNGSFDTSLDGWSSARSQNGTSQWSNGTAVLTSGSGKGIAQLDQCVNILPNTRYEAGFTFVVGAGQPAGSPSFGVFEYWTPNCDPINAVQFSRTEPANGYPLGVPIDWISSPNARSVLIAIGAGSNSGPYTATFDDVYLRPNP